MKRFNSFLREKGFYLALGVGIVAFAALIFLYDYKDADKELTKEQAIDLNKAKVTEEVADSSDAKVEATVDNKTDDKVNTSSEPVKDKTDKPDVQNIDGADGEEIQNIVGKDTVEPVEKEDEASNAGEGGEVAEVSSDGTISNAVAELNYDGTQGLLWPLNGEVILPYSMDTTVYYKTLELYKCNPGMLISAEEGNSVFSVYEGIVEEVKETKEYGTEVIVNLGNDYKVIYGQLMNVAVKTGDEVAKATIIGQVAPVSDYFKKEGTNLFFEVTKDGKPVNPVTLID